MSSQPGHKTLLNAVPQITLNNQGQILVFHLTSDQHILGREPGLPFPQGLRVPEDWFVSSRCQAYFRKIGNDYFVYDGDGTTPSTNRLFVNNTVITPSEGHRLQNGDEIRIGQNPRNWITMTYADPTVSPVGKGPKQRSISLKGGTLTIGRDSSADLELDTPTVSRRHATIQISDGGHYVLQDHSTNGVFVNQQRVSGSIVLKSGDAIQIGSYTFVLQDSELFLADQGNHVRLDARNLVRTVIGKKGQRTRLLNDITLVVEPGQFVALVGGSGAGKSTLLKTLLGVEPNTEGTVMLNGNDLRSNFNIYRSLIGYVPQADIVHLNLRVREVLYYAAKLRLPSDINVEPLIEKTLHQVELTERQNTMVRNLSGGQLKRVSIAVELLADPKIFFLDEPTSGLDPGLDKKMMQLLRKLADEGRTIVLVTHATNNIMMCDRIAFLGLGGNLCYLGAPQDAIKFFQTPSNDFADIYIQLDTRDAVAQETTRFARSPYYKQYIEDRLTTPNQTQQGFSEQVKRSFFQQLVVLIQRYVKLMQRDPVYLALSLLTAPIAIALIAIAVQAQGSVFPGLAKLLEMKKQIGQEEIKNLNLIFSYTAFIGEGSFKFSTLAQKVLFVFTCAGIWVGFSASLQEIVKESAIYLRERLVNLRLFAYLGSKVLTLGGLAALQTLLISIVILTCFDLVYTKPVYTPLGLSEKVNLWFQLAQPGDPYLVAISIIGVIITTFLTIFASMSLGLLVSSWVKNSTQASVFLPLLLLPQIIFSGILFNMEKVQIISSLMLSRWSVSAYGTLANVNNQAPVNLSTFASDKAIAEQIEKSVRETEYLFSGNIFMNWGALVLHAVVYLAIAFWLLKRKDVVKQ